MTGSSTRRRALAVIAAGLIGLLAAGCGNGGGGASGGGAQVLKVASQRGATRAVVEASGALQGAPYKVEWSEFAAASPLLEALSAGAVDVGGVGDAPFVFAYAAGAPIKAVAAFQSGANGSATAVVVPKGSTIRTPADLKGRKVATIKGSIGHYLLLRLLQKAGVPENQVQAVFLEPGASRAALSSGSVDAWATWSPYIGMVTLSGEGRILADANGLLTGVGFFAASDKAIARKAPLIDDFLKRVATANQWAHAHPEDYAKALAKDTGLPLDVARDAAKRYGGQRVPLDPALIRQEDETLESFRRAGVIQNPPKIDQAFSTRFQPAAGG